MRRGCLKRHLYSQVSFRRRGGGGHDHDHGENWAAASGVSDAEAARLRGSDMKGAACVAVP